MTGEMLFSGPQSEPSRAPRALRVLIAEDERDTALTLMMLLREEGHEVRAVHTGRSAMSTVIQFDPDAAIIDIALPDMSGWQVAQTIRARQKDRPLLIGISGQYIKGPDKVLAEMSGFHHYLVKPCAAADLLRLIEPLRDPSPSR